MKINISDESLFSEIEKRMKSISEKVEMNNKLNKEDIKFFDY